MTKTSTTIWDPSTHLRTTDDVAAYLGNPEKRDPPFGSKHCERAARCRLDAWLYSGQ